MVIITMLFNVLGCFRKNTQKPQMLSTVHTPQVHAAFYNSQSDRIALCCTNGSLYLTDNQLRVINQTQAHTGNAHSSFFSLDDKYIITGGKDKALRLWKADSLTLKQQFNFDFAAFTSVCGYHTLCGCGEKGKLLMYNFTTKQLNQINLGTESAYHLYYVIPDSLLVVSGGKQGYEVNISTKQITQRYIGHTNQVYCIMPSTDKKRVVTASKDSTVMIFDRESGKQLFQSPVLDGVVFVASFSPDDSRVAASTSAGSIYFFDTALSKQQLKIKALNGRINTIHFSKDGTQILAGSEQAGAKIFSTETGKMLYEFKPNQ